MYKKVNITHFAHLLSFNFHIITCNYFDYPNHHPSVSFMSIKKSQAGWIMCWLLTWQFVWPTHFNLIMITLRYYQFPNARDEWTTYECASLFCLNEWGMSNWASTVVVEHTALTQIAQTQLELFKFINMSLKS